MHYKNTKTKCYVFFQMLLTEGCRYLGISLLVFNILPHYSIQHGSALLCSGFCLGPSILLLLSKQKCSPITETVSNIGAFLFQLLIFFAYPNVFTKTCSLFAVDWLLFPTILLISIPLCFDYIDLIHSDIHAIEYLKRLHVYIRKRNTYKLKLIISLFKICIILFFMTLASFYCYTFNEIWSFKSSIDNNTKQTALITLCIYFFVSIITYSSSKVAITIGLQTYSCYIPLMCASLLTHIVVILYCAMCIDEHTSSTCRLDLMSHCSNQCVPELYIDDAFWLVPLSWISYILVSKRSWIYSGAQHGLQNASRQVKIA